jgi:hypothetical protein
MRRRSARREPRSRVGSYRSVRHAANAPQTCRKRNSTDRYGLIPMWPLSRAFASGSTIPCVPVPPSQGGDTGSNPVGTTRKSRSDTGSNPVGTTRKSAGQRPCPVLSDDSALPFVPLCPADDRDTSRSNRPEGRREGSGCVRLLALNGRHRGAGEPRVTRGARLSVTGRFGVGPPGVGLGSP